MEPLARRDRYTYKDYCDIPGEERYEVIEGILYQMTPAPSRRHQDLLGGLFTAFHNHLRGHACRVYCAPFDVRLPARGEKDDEAGTVVQPDISVICDPGKLDDLGCLGSPDLIIEIASRGSASRDYVKKLALYERHGVREYWVVHQDDRTVMVFTLNDSGEYGRPAVYSSEDTVKAGLFPDLAIDLASLFSEAPERP
ncbi:MAG: Uma2 family endonuclease [Candidatus Eremiobacteraeota bacterium]|nr:Uma2 family endonuclease [Candidatus Eremiobacteraeota bacterium]